MGLDELVETETDPESNNGQEHGHSTRSDSPSQIRNADDFKDPEHTDPPTPRSRPDSGSENANSNRSGSRSTSPSPQKDGSNASGSTSPNNSGGRRTPPDTMQQHS